MLRRMRYRPKSALDLACGTGVLCTLLSADGLKVTGVDGSKDALRAARRKKTTKGIRFVQGDVCEVRFKQQYDLVTCCFDSINHITNKRELKKLFRTVSIHLRPGGFFVFDAITLRGLHHWKGEQYERGEDYWLCTEGRLGAGKTVMIQIEWMIRRPDGRYDYHEEKIVERAYTIRELASALTASGFHNILVESFDTDLAIRSTDRLLFICPTSLST